MSLKEMISKLTLEDALALYENGTCCVLADGKLKCFEKRCMDETQS